MLFNPTLDWNSKTVPADKHRPARQQGLCRTAGGCSCSRRSAEALLSGRLGGFLSASSVPHNWLSFASSLLGWESSKSLEGKASHHKKLPKIRGLLPGGEIHSSGSLALPVPSAQSQVTLARQRTLQLLAKVQNFPAITCFLLIPPSHPKRGGTTAQTQCNFGCHYPNYTPQSSCRTMHPVLPA
jgi:hypothetical protein